MLSMPVQERSRDEAARRAGGSAVLAATINVRYVALRKEGGRHCSARCLPRVSDRAMMESAIGSFRWRGHRKALQYAGRRQCNSRRN